MLPTFLVIGAKKAGTTSLHRYLASHPDVWIPDTKRLEFFSTDAWDRGVGWYERQFAPGASARARGEISTSYTRFPIVPDTAARIGSVIPDAKLVYLIRHPIERVVAHYRQAVVEGWEGRPIDEAILANPAEFIARSRYALQLEQYLAVFPRDQILVRTTEELRTERAATIAAIFDFIGVDPGFRPPRLEQTHHSRDDLRIERAGLRTLRRSAAFRAVRRAVPGPVRERAWRAVNRRPEFHAGQFDLSAATRDEIIGRLRPDLVTLRGILGDDFDCWGLLEDAS